MVVVNMEMPTKCSQCGFCINQKTNDYGSFGECSLQDRKTVDCLVWSRDSGCPLVEIVTCKDCKYWDEPYCNLINNFTDGDYYCASAKRRKQNG